MSKGGCHQLQVSRCLLEAWQRNRQPENKQRQKQLPRHRPTPKIERRSPQQNRQSSHRHPRLQSPVSGRVQKRTKQHHQQTDPTPLPNRIPQTPEPIIHQTGNDQRKQRTMLIIVFRIPCRPEPAQSSLTSPGTIARLHAVKPYQHQDRSDQRPVLEKSRDGPVCISHAGLSGSGWVCVRRDQKVKVFRAKYCRAPRQCQQSAANAAPQ